MHILFYYLEVYACISNICLFLLSRSDFYLEKMAQRKTQLVYKPEFLKFGFTEMRERSGNVRPQCLQCLQVLACESMKENKLKRHLQTVHPKFVEKPLSYWKDKEEQIKRSRIDTPSSSFFFHWRRLLWRPLRWHG